MGKLSDNEFFAALRESAGLFSRTVRYIKKEYDVDITRQSVHTRAHKRPDILKDIEEQNIDVAEEGLHSIMRSKNESLRLKACLEFLSYKAKERGYIKTVENINKNIGDQLDISKLSVADLKVYEGILNKLAKE